MTGTVVDREFPTGEAADLLELTRELVAKELQPRADKSEAAGSFPRELFSQLGELGLLSLPYPEEFGGGGQPASVYLQVLEELARGWATVALGTSVHVLACSAVADFGSRRAAGTVPAGDARRQHARRVLPVGVARRLGRRCDADPGSPRRRRVRAHRRQGVDHPRSRRRLPAGGRTNRRRRRTRASARSWFPRRRTV